MAGDWIRMRPSLLTSPKVNGIARELESSTEAAQALARGGYRKLSQAVTRNVTRYVTVTALLLVWGAANEHTNGGVFVNADLSDIDDIAGIPGFGAAMVAAGWAIVDEQAMTVTLPNFNEYNNSAKERSTSAAERQRRYRERKSSQSDASGDVTRDVTLPNREEKKREEKKEKTSPVGGDLLGSVDPKVAKDFRELRSRKKAPITETAIAGIKREAERAGMTLEQALRTCCERGWTGFKADWVQRDGGQQQGHAHDPGRLPRLVA